LHVHKNMKNLQKTCANHKHMICFIIALSEKFIAD